VTIRVAVVDDHDMFAQSVARVLRDEEDIEVVGVAESAAAGLRLVEELAPDVVVIDFRLPDADGIVTTKHILAARPGTRVLMLSGSGENNTVADAIRAGCCGFLTKDRAVKELVRAVRIAQAGQAYLAPETLVSLLPRLDRAYRRLGDDLTTREREVLHLVATGLTNHDIAAELGLSTNTVRNHVQNVLTKLGAHSKLQAAAVARAEGLLDQHD